METNGYTGRKLTSYIWIPKSKTDLREFREILKICADLQRRNGFFSDKTLGEEMVALRAIVDRDNTADSYIEKYQNKSIGNQSYISNARMMLRILRWLGLVTKDYNPDESGKFYITPHASKFLNFSGPFPARFSSLDELNLFEECFSRLRFHSVNDDIRYRNYQFRQRFFYNMLRVLGKLEFASHYELALSSLVLKDDSEDEFNEKLKKITSCRDGKNNLRWLMSEYGLDCDNKSTLTGIYDGPKVLLSFAKQLGLVEEIVLNHESEKGKVLIGMYSKIYTKSGHISPKSIKKCTRITPKGLEFLKKYKNPVSVWYDEIDGNREENAALLLVCKKNGFLEHSSTRSIDIDKRLLRIDDGKIILCFEVDFDLYRDVPYESRRKVIEIIKTMDPNYFDIDEVIDVKEIMFLPTSIPSKRCLECSFKSCGFYKEKINAFGGRDRFASRVCPENAISFNESGIFEINEEACVGCALCMLNCSFDGITYSSDGVFHKAKNSIDNSEKLNAEEKRKNTEELIQKYSFTKPKIKVADVPGLVKLFLRKINLPERKWDKDRCYVYVRNVFRLFGVEAIYSGSGGMKTRSDVTIETPFIAVSEVKSPAESPINMKAVRQAVDAAIQADTKLTMAIGIETHSGAIEQELKYRKNTGIGILLLELQYLAFISLVSEYFSFTPESLRYLITTYKGRFNKELLKDFLFKQDSLLTKDEIEDLIAKTF